MRVPPVDGDALWDYAPLPDVCEGLCRDAKLYQSNMPLVPHGSLMRAIQRSNRRSAWCGLTFLFVDLLRRLADRFERQP